MYAHGHTEAVDAEYNIVVLVSSAGGLIPLRQLLGGIWRRFLAPIVIFQHRSRTSPSSLVELLNARSRVPIEWAEQGARLQPGTGYVVRPDTTPIFLNDGRYGLDNRVREQHWQWGASHFLQSCAAVFSRRVVAVLLTGAGTDGASGAVAVKAAGGIVLVQALQTCFSKSMPLAAIEADGVHFILSTEGIASALNVLVGVPGAAGQLVGIPVNN